jgi:hypothetical protein
MRMAAFVENLEGHKLGGFLRASATTSMLKGVPDFPGTRSSPPGQPPKLHDEVMASSVALPAGRVSINFALDLLRLFQPLYQSPGRTVRLPDFARRRG